MQFNPYSGINLKERGGIGGMPKGKSKARYNLGYGAIYQRKTKTGKIRWYLDYRCADGSRIQKVAPLAITKEEAALALKNEVAKAFTKEYEVERKKGSIGFRDFAEIYLKNYLCVERKNWRSDSYRLKKLIDFFNDTKLKEITPNQIRGFKKDRQIEGNSESTINRYLALLKRMFNVAIEDGYIDDNPVKKVKLASEKDTKRERILSMEEEERLLKACSDHVRPIVIIALNTGMRLGEIVNSLKWKNVLFSRREIIVEKSKSKKVRFIPMNRVVFDELVHLRTKNRNSDLVFPYKSIRTAFEYACKRAAIKDFTFHDTRRTFGTRLLERGCDIVTIQKLYGHSSPLVTQRYLHPNNEISKEAVELLVENSKKTPKNKENLLHNCDMAKIRKSRIFPNSLFSLN